MQMTINKFSSARETAIANAHRSTLRVRVIDNPSVRAILQMFPRNMRKDVRVSTSDYSNTVHFSLYLRNLDSLKDRKLERALAPFLAEEWSTSSTDYAHEVPNRDFRFIKKMDIPMPDTPSARWLAKRGFFWHDDKSVLPVEICVFISAYVKADSDSCRIEIERKEEVVIREIPRIVCA
jgi:hypothetical protein